MEAAAHAVYDSVQHYALWSCYVSPPLPLLPRARAHTHTHTHTHTLAYTHRDAVLKANTGPDWVTCPSSVYTTSAVPTWFLRVWLVLLSVMPTWRFSSCVCVKPQL